MCQTGVETFYGCRITVTQTEALKERGLSPVEKQVALPRPAKLHCCPAPQNTIAAPPRPPRGSGQNCWAFAGQNKNLTLDSIKVDYN